MFSVRPYLPGDGPAWDALVASSRNGNVLHRRGYMDYHADRFVDASLLIERGGEVVAVLPANVEGDCVSSHAGLTYAGLLSSRALRAGATLQVFEQMAAHYRARGVHACVQAGAAYLSRVSGRRRPVCPASRGRAAVPARPVLGDRVARAVRVQRRTSALAGQGTQGRCADPGRHPTRRVSCPADRGVAAPPGDADPSAGRAAIAATPVSAADRAA